MSEFNHFGKSDERLLAEIEELEKEPNELAVSDLAWVCYSSLISELQRRREAGHDI